MLIWKPSVQGHSTARVFFFLQRAPTGALGKDGWGQAGVEATRKADLIRSSGKLSVC